MSNMLKVVRKKHPVLILGPKIRELEQRVDRPDHLGLLGNSFTFMYIDACSLPAAWTAQYTSSLRVGTLFNKKAASFGNSERVCGLRVTEHKDRNCPPSGYGLQL